MAMLALSEEMVRRKLGKRLLFDRDTEVVV